MQFLNNIWRSFIILLLVFGYMKMDQGDQKAKVVNRFLKSNKEFELSIRLTWVCKFLLTI